jgi:hypothetical protein
MVPPPVAQLSYDRDVRLWTLYWPDCNSRWHRYDDLEPGSVDTLLDEFDDDPTCIIWA